MEKITFGEFKEILKTMQGKNLIIKLSKIVGTDKKINNAQIVINSNRIFISDDKDEEINIDINYVSNFFMHGKKLIMELDSKFEITIYEEQTI